MQKNKSKMEQRIPINKKQPCEFVRFGGLSKVNYKYLRREPTEPGEGKPSKFHRPPVKNGVYAFIYPYMEDFLWAWKVKTKNVSFKTEYRRLRKKFTYKGYVWTHFVDEAIKYSIGNRYNDSWVEIHTDDLYFLLNKVMHNDIVYLCKDANLYNTKQIHDPYKRGLGGIMCRDHLEVFIEKVN